MNDLRRLFRFGATDLPGRPLLFVAGAAATTAGVFYFMIKRDSGEKTAENQILIEGSCSCGVLCADAVSESDMVSDVDDVRVSQSDSAVPEVPWAEEIYEQAINSLAQLEKEKSKLLTELNKLQIFEQELKNGLSKAQEKHDRLATHKQKGLELIILQTTHNAIKAFKQKECVDMHRDYTEMRSRYHQLEETLKDTEISLAKTREKYYDTYRWNDEVITHLQRKLIQVYSEQYNDKVNLQNEKVSLESKYEEALKQCNKLQMECKSEQNDYCALKSECDQIKKTSIHHTESEKVHTLQAVVQQLEEEVCEARKMYCDIEAEQAKTQEMRRNLKAQHTALMETLKQFFELLKIHPGPAETEEPGEPQEISEPEEPVEPEEPLKL
ncbi:centrosomal protein of 112 kDa-like isoform X2 [Tachysurus fulvidraco]|uniref:centrosomal protein of 112 kDa-like isoform X2 n=1 Tax=Tachysurus fulvidraco TaxID=1234273 RepID=UPI001FEF03C7|nr:centrosomal protein of 112 kDa-like isoform X2 [Tachysurus fulvidraco]